MEATRWLGTTAKTRQRLLKHPRLRDVDFMRIVEAPEGWGVFASVGPNFRHAIFGRDSIEVASDLCSTDRQLAHDIILTLARLQGTKHDQRSEEEPGKIHHEYRALYLADSAAPQDSVEIMRRLQAMWGNDASDTMLYYGTYDATPLYVRLVEQYTAKYGTEILDEAYTDRSREARTIKDSVLAATEWLVAKLQERPDHLLAYRRLNPQGLENQVWKDSRTSYLFNDGSLPNFDAGIVSTELQGYAYDALRYAATLSVERGAAYNQLAEDVQRHTLEKLWMADQQFFAQGIGTDIYGLERLLDNLTSNGALLLDSRLLADLPPEQAKYYSEAITQTILGPQFRTTAGIRCRAVRHAKLLEYVDYHGSYAVWPKETFDIARGLKRFGYTKEAKALESDLLQTIQTAGDFYELFYVDLDGAVWYDPLEATARFSSAAVGEPLPVPEPGQAWTISAAVASAHDLPAKPRSSMFWVQDLLEKNWYPLPDIRAKNLSLMPQLLQSIQTVLKRPIHFRKK